jgi:hypothetical protein
MGLFAGVKQPGRDVDHPLYLVPWLKKEYSYTSSVPLGLYGTVIQGSGKSLARPGRKQAAATEDFEFI